MWLYTKDKNIKIKIVFTLFLYLFFIFLNSCYFNNCNFLTFNSFSKFVSSYIPNLGPPWWLRWLKNPPAVRETWMWSPSWEDPLEKGMATHSSILAWRIPWTEEPGRLQSTGLQRVGHDWVTFTYLFTSRSWGLGFQHTFSGDAADSLTDVFVWIPCQTYPETSSILVQVICLGKDLRRQLREEGQ